MNEILLILVCGVFFWVYTLNATYVANIFLVDYNFIKKYPCKEIVKVSLVQFVLK